MPSQHPSVNVVIPVWNSGKWLPGCLTSLCFQTFRDFSLILVDNGSRDGSVDCVLEKQYPFPVDVISLPENLGFATAVNNGIKAATGRYIALLNVDTLADPGWLTELVGFMEQSSPEVGALASAMLRMDDPNLMDDAGDILSWYGSAMKRGHDEPLHGYQKVEEVFSVCAGAALYRKTFFEKVGYFDEKFTSYLEDVDICLRGKICGYRYIYMPSAVVRHQGHSAGITGSYYVFLMTRNRLLTFLKNIPCCLLLRHLHQVVYGQLYYLLVYRRPLASIRGYLSLLFLLPHIIRSRRTILSCSESIAQISDSLLSSRFGEPSLWALVKKRLG